MMFTWLASSTTLGTIADHLWQSTIFAAAVALLTLAFRRHHAHVRHWLWVAASAKFLVPFAALAAFGRSFGWRTGVVASPDLTGLAVALDGIALPFSAPAASLAGTMPAAAAATEATGGVALALAALAAIWLAGCAGISTRWLRQWLRVAAAVRAAAPIESGHVHESLRRLGASLPLRASDVSLEPGVFGILRPVLLWPRAMDAHLDEGQIEAVLAHELAHVRRRDNLAAAMHMVVSAIFWFHPLVWWIGARLVEERERACDEEVVRLGTEPHVYAESILKTCQFCIESPLTCVPGVTGSDLKTRILRIMTHQAGTSLAPWNRRLLMTAAAATVAAPVVAGALTPGTALTTSQAPSADRHRFEVAAVRPNATGAMRVRMQIMPGGAYEASNVTLESVIRMAYRLQEFQLAGGPDWIYRDRFDIVVKSPQSASPIDFLERMQSLLGERFQLKVRTETRELPIYALVLAHDDGRLGPRLTTGTIDCAALVRARASSADGDEADLLPRPGERPTCGTWTAMGRLAGGGVTMDQLATSLSQHTGRVVVNRTGLNGSFDFDLEFAPDPALRGRGPGGGLPPAPPDARPPSPGGVSIFAAVREQLGLRLDARRGPVEVLVVDSAERPMAD